MHAVFALGDFLNAFVSFALVMAAVYFFVVTPIDALVARMRKAPAPADPTTKKCPNVSAKYRLTPAGVHTVLSLSGSAIRRSNKGSGQRTRNGQ
jgi:hypothetical protein